MILVSPGEGCKACNRFKQVCLVVNGDAYPIIHVHFENSRRVMNDLLISGGSRNQLLDAYLFEKSSLTSCNPR